MDQQQSPAVALASPSISPLVSAGPPRPPLPAARFLILWTTLLCALIFTSRLLGPPDLMDDDQQRPAAYVMDALRNGDWIVQRAQSGDVMSKPPLSTWVTALVALPFGRINAFLLALPCALATLALAWLIVGAGIRHFGRGGALLGATAYLLSMVAFKQVALVRTDSLFALFTFLGALAAFRAWERQSGWTLFWLVAAASTLTKGPLGLLLSAGGLWAAAWERRSGASRPLRGAQGPGILLYFALTLGWFLLAYHELGRALIDKMIGNELLGQAVKSEGGSPALIHFYVPPFYFLTRFAPWSLLALAGFWRIWRHPAAGAGERRFERFLCCYFFSGLIIFSLAGHQRPDLLWPLIPAAALIAGREAARLWQPSRPRRLMAVLTAAVLLFLLAGNLYLFLIRTRDPNVQETRRVRELAAAIRRQVGDGFPLIPVGAAPFGLQFYLNTMHFNVPAARAIQALTGPEAAFVLVDNPEEFKKRLPAAVPRYELLQCKTLGKAQLTVISNHPRLEYTPRMATIVGPELIRMEGLHLLRATSRELVFWAHQPAGQLSLTNQSSSTQALRVTILNARPETSHPVELPPGATWSQGFGRPAPAQGTLKAAQFADCRGAYAQLDRLGRTGAFAGIDYLFVNGDFVFESDWQFDLFLQQARRLGLPVYPVPGNHERVIDSPYPLEPFMNRFGYRYTHFDDGPARFILLDSSAGEIDQPQFDYLEGLLKAPANPPQRFIFQHVPPSHLDTKHFIHFGAAGRQDDRSLLLDMAARGKVSRIYSGHINGFKATDYPTSFGLVRGVISSGGGEKGGEKDYRQHWLELDIAPGREVRETPHDIPVPTDGERYRSALRFRGAFLATLYAPRVLVVLGLGLFFTMLARKVLAVGRRTPRW